VQQDEKNRYDKSGYAAKRKQREAAGADGAQQASGADGAQGRIKSGRTNKAGADSRCRAGDRYRQEERHASGGGDQILQQVEHAASSSAKKAGELKGKLSGGSWRDVLTGQMNGKKVAIIVVVVLLLALLAWYLVLANNMRPSEDVSKSVTSEGFGKPYYVLLLGSDSRAEADEVARADSIMLARVDESAKKVTLVSLPRDLMVDIEGHGASKLNSALTYGGFSGAIDAASKLAGVPISYYAVVYFSGFKQLVDDLGGVTVEVPEGTYYKGTWVPAGKHSKINGKEALVLARCRHGNPPDQGAYAAGDFQRTKNQRNLMKAIVKEALSKNPLQLPGVLTSISSCVETNMPPQKMAMLALAMRGMDADKMYTAVVPCSSQYINGVSWQVVNEAEWQAMMQKVEAGKDPTK